MKTAHVVLSLFVVILLLAGCDLMLIGKDVQFIEPSNTIITEERTVSGFTGIDFSTFGKVVLTQGDTEVADHQRQRQHRADGQDLRRWRNPANLYGRRHQYHQHDR